MASNIANNEMAYFDQYDDVCFIYIFRTTPKGKEVIYRNLCSKRVRGTVYFDTDNSFIKANPDFPENQMLHTFVINSEGEVLLAGDPFQNENMRNLFQKIVDRKDILNK